MDEMPILALNFPKSSKFHLLCVTLSKSIEFMYGSYFFFPDRIGT